MPRPARRQRSEQYTIESHSPRDAHFLRFSKDSPHAGHTFDSRALPFTAEPFDADPFERRAEPATYSPLTCLTCFQNAEKLPKRLSGIG